MLHTAGGGLWQSRAYLARRALLETAAGRARRGAGHVRPSRPPCRRTPDIQFRWQARGALVGEFRHGGSRKEGRKQAMKSARNRSIASELKEQGILVMAKSKSTLAEEIRKGVDVHDQISVRIIRAYIDHWEEIEKPLNKRITGAVLKAMEGRSEAPSTEVQYHEQFLKLDGN